MSRTSNRAASGTGTIRKITVNQNGKNYTYWQARCTTGYDPGTGKQLQRTITGKTQKEVSLRLRELTSDLDHGTYLEPNKLTVRSWLTTWQEEYLQNVKPSTAYKYKVDIENYIIPRLGATKLEDLATPMIQHFYNDLLHPKKPGVKPLTAKTVRCVHGIFHSALSKAVQLGYIRMNPTDACELPRVVKKEIVPLEDDQIAAFLKAIVGHPHEYLYKIALFTGMREGEVLGLTWDCIDFRRGRLVVRRQLVRDRQKGGEYHFSTPKNGKIRVIVLAPTVVQLFREQQKRQTLMMMDAGKKWVDNNLIFSNQTGGYLSYRTVYDCFKRVMTKLGLPETRFHDLRHTYAVAAIKSGDVIKTVQENLGHATAAFTLDVYGHVTNQMKEASASRMELFISAVSS